MAWPCFIKASVKRLGYEEYFCLVLSGIIYCCPSLDRWAFLVLNQARMCTILFHDGFACPWQGQSLSPLLFFPPLPRSHDFLVDIFSEETRAVAQSCVWRTIFFLPQRHQWLPQSSPSRAASFHMGQL